MYKISQSMLQIKKISEAVNRTKMFKLVAITFLVCFNLFSQQGKYQKKSVSALTDLYIFNGAETGSKVDIDQFNKLVNEQIKLPRFDYVILPKALTSDLLAELNSTANLSSEIITAKINEIVVPKIIEILNDDKILALRSSSAKSNISEQTMAGSKAKSMGLTRAELGVLMNSAYFYFPFISTNSSNGTSGGILWYNLNVDKNNVTSIKLVSSINASAEGINSTDLVENPITKIKEPYNQVLSTFMKNLSVQTRKIEDFRITGQVAEIVSSKKFTAPVGIAQGIYLDNGFDIINYTEDEQGNTVVNNIGFGRIDKNAYAKGENATIFRYIGNSPTEGDIIRERPNFGIDAKVKFGYKSGLEVLQRHSRIFDLTEFILIATYSGILSAKDLDAYFNITNTNNKDKFALSGDASSAFGLDVSMEYNLAPVVKISQLFFAFDAGFYVPIAEPNLNTEAFTYIIPFKSSILKKFWLGRMNINASVGAGVDMFNVSGTKLKVLNVFEDANWTLSTISPSVDFKGSFEYLINPDLAFTFGAGYTLSMQPLAVTYTLDEREPVDLTISMIDNYSDLKLGGISISAGITYTIPKLELDWFDFLDKLKKY